MKELCKGPCFNWLTIEHCIEFYKEGLTVVFNDARRITIVDEKK